MRHDAALGVVPPDFILDLDAGPDVKTRGAAGRSRRGHLDRAPRGGEGPGRPLRPRRRAHLGAADRCRRSTARSPRRGRCARAPSTMPASGGSRTGRNSTRPRCTTRRRRGCSPAEVHKFGLDQAREISARLDGLLKAQGMTQGTVGQRMAALYKDPAQLYPNTDAGKAQAIAYCNARLAAIRTAAAERVQPRAALPVRGPPRAAADRGRRRVGFLARRRRSTGRGRGSSTSTCTTPPSGRSSAWRRPSITKGLPGHQFEGGLALSNQDLPLIRKTGGFSGYGEGWALYAEQLADEMGMYDEDPLGRLGYLKFQLFRANRCVVDTGIHHARAGAASRRSAISSSRTARRRASPRARSSAIASRPARRAATSSAIGVHRPPREGEGRAGAEIRHQGLPRRRAGHRPRAARDPAAGGRPLDRGAHWLTFRRKTSARPQTCSTKRGLRSTAELGPSTRGRGRENCL